MNATYRLFAFILVICCCRTVVDAFPPTTNTELLDLVLYRSQYTVMFVGSEGRESLLRIRFDSNEIILYAPALVPSATYDPIDSTEHISLGAARGYRWKVRYTAQGDPSVSDPVESDDRTAHQGVFGLGPQSPVWQMFDSLTYSPTHLVLGWVSPQTQFVYNDSVVQVDPSTDYTVVTWDLYAKWIRASVANTDYVPFIEILPGVGVWVPLNDSFVPFSSSLTASSVRIWEDQVGSEHVKLGFHHLRSLVFSMTHATTTTRVASLVHYSVHIRQHDYLWLLVALFLVDWVWYPSLSELLHRIYWAYPARSTPNHRGLRDADWSLVSTCSLWIVLLAMFGIHASLTSYRAMQAMAEPYDDVNDILALVVYYVLLSYVVAVFALSRIHRISDASVSHRATSLYLLGWLVLSAQFHESINIILMILLAALAFLRQCDLLFRHVYVRGWANWRSWIWLLTVLATGWFFAFYTLSEYIEERWTGHPSEFFIEAFALAITFAIGSFEPLVREHSNHFRELIRRLSGDSRVMSATPAAVDPRSTQVSLAYLYSTNAFSDPGGIVG